MRQYSFSKDTALTEKLLYAIHRSYIHKSCANRTLRVANAQNLIANSPLCVSDKQVCCLPLAISLRF